MDDFTIASGRMIVVVVSIVVDTLALPDHRTKPNEDNEN